MAKFKSSIALPVVITTSLFSALYLYWSKKQRSYTCNIRPGSIEFGKEVFELTDAQKRYLKDGLAKEMVDNPDVRCRVVVQGNGGATRVTQELCIKRMFGIVDVLVNYNSKLIPMERIVIQVSNEGEEEKINFKAY